jgi:hypothetical protein
MKQGDFAHDPTNGMTVNDGYRAEYGDQLLVVTKRSGSVLIRIYDTTRRGQPLFFQGMIGDDIEGARQLAIQAAMWHRSAASKPTEWQPYHETESY